MAATGVERAWKATQNAFAALRTPWLAEDFAPAAPSPVGFDLLWEAEPSPMSTIVDAAPQASEVGPDLTAADVTPDDSWDEPALPAPQSRARSWDDDDLIVLPPAPVSPETVHQPPRHDPAWLAQALLALCDDPAGGLASRLKSTLLDAFEAFDPRMVHRELERLAHTGPLDAEQLLSAVRLKLHWLDRPDLWLHRRGGRDAGVIVAANGPQLLSWRAAYRIAGARSEHDSEGMVDLAWLDEWRGSIATMIRFPTFAAYARAAAARVPDHDVMDGWGLCEESYDETLSDLSRRLSRLGHGLQPFDFRGDRWFG